MVNRVVCGALIRSFPWREDESGDGAAGTADEVAGLGYVVGGEDSVEDFPAEVQDDDQDEGQGDFLLTEGSHGGQDDEGEDNAGGAQQACGEERVVDDGGDEGGGSDDDQNAFAAVFLFQDGTQEEEEEHIADVVREVGVAQHMGEAPHVGQWVEQGRAIGGEEHLGCPIVGEHAQDEGDGRNDGESQNDGRIICYLHIILNINIVQFVESINWRIIPPRSLTIRNIRKKNGDMQEGEGGRNC